jgi:hypothetical protein
MMPLAEDLYLHVLEGDELAEHCQNYFWKLCDRAYLYMKYLLDCKEAGYTHEEKHTMLRSLYDMFHIVFADGDFGFFNDRLARISFSMALESAKAEESERAIAELENVAIYCEKCKDFTEIEHSSLLVNKIKIDQTNIAKSSAETLGHSYLRYLNNNDGVFASIKGDSRYTEIKQRLAAL